MAFGLWLKLIKTLIHPKSHLQLFKTVTEDNDKYRRHIPRKLQRYNNIMPRGRPK